MPLALAGLLGAIEGPRYGMIVGPGGDAVAVRGPGGHLAVIGRVNSFAAEQWLRADGDGRSVAGLRGRVAEAGRCDALACVVPLPGGQILSLVTDARAFAEDCGRADVIVTPLRAPASCGASLIVDRDSLATTGALGFALRNGGWVPDPARAAMEDRPWSPAPRARRVRPAPPDTPADPDDAADSGAPSSDPARDDTSP